MIRIVASLERELATARTAPPPGAAGTAVVGEALPWPDTVAVKLRSLAGDVAWYLSDMLGLGFNPRLLLTRLEAHEGHLAAFDWWTARLVALFQQTEPYLPRVEREQTCLAFRYVLLGAYLSCHVGLQDTADMDDADFTAEEWAAAQYRATLAAAPGGSIAAAAVVKRRRVPFHKSEVGFKLPRALTKARGLVKAMQAHVIEMRRVETARPTDFEFLLETERAHSAFDALLTQIAEAGGTAGATQLSVSGAVDEVDGLVTLIKAVEAGFSGFRGELEHKLEATPMKPTGAAARTGLKRKGIKLNIGQKKAKDEPKA